MALEYTLMIETDLKLTEIKNILSQDFESESDYLKAPGLIIYIDYADDEDKAYVKNSFDFTPKFSLCFIQDKFADFSLAQANLIKATTTLLKSSSNAILDFNGDTVLLRQVQNHLFIYQDDNDFWEDYLLNLIPLPYEIKTEDTLPEMTKTDNFNQGEGFFYEKDKYICLEYDVAKFLKQLAIQKQTSLDKIVNVWLKRDIQKTCEY